MPISDYLYNLRQKVGNDLLISPGAGGIVINDKGEVLLQLRSDTRTWGIPGGAMDPGEEPAETAVREIFEETGIRVIPERITSVISGEDFFHTYPNGNQIALVSIMFLCRPVKGDPIVNDEESLEVRYFPRDALPENMIPRHRMMVEIALRDDQRTYFRKPDGN